MRIFQPQVPNFLQHQTTRFLLQSSLLVSTAESTLRSVRSSVRQYTIYLEQPLSVTCMAGPVESKSW